MESCPNELLAQIVEFLPESDLFNLRLVVRRLRDVATRHAFNRLVIYDNIYSVRRFHDLVTECDDSMILHAVETVIFDGTAPDHFDMGAEPTTAVIETSFSLINRLPNIQMLKLDFFPGSAPDKNEMYLTYYVEIQLAFWTSLASAPIPRLRSLHIGSMVTYFPRFMEPDDPLLAFFRPLTHISLSLVSLFQVRHPPTEILSFHANVTNMLVSAENLTSLELGSNELAGRTSSFVWENMTGFSALTTLVLDTFMFAGQPDDEPIPPQPHGQALSAETFILNYKKTLQRLTLRECAVALPDGAWYRVLKRLQQLSQLVEFNWVVWGREGHEHFLYGRPVGHLRTYTVVDDDPSFATDEERDLNALQNLESVVLLRRNNAPS
ncbi:hypothetical protein C8R44DRAFT_757020 [Mycena epipterygia]|nr:hypothetical protein C8R44DRAFT_757020 [Mycena epipterygia]